MKTLSGFPTVEDFENGIELKTGGNMQEPVTNEPKTLADFECYRVTLEKEVPLHEHVIKIGDATIGKAGNLLGVSGETKAGKTAAKDILIAKTIGFSGFPDITIAENINQKAVISIDCEQDEDDQQYSLQTTLKRTGLPRLPKWFCAYNFLKMDMKAYKEETYNLFYAAQKEYGGIHLAFIDGGTDYLISGVNDERESIELTHFFIKLAIEFKCTIIIIVHLNENASKTGNDTMRGHFGKYVSRKAYGQLNVTKKGDVSTMQVLRGRKAGADTPEIHFTYSREHGYHIPVNGQDIQDTKQEARERTKRDNHKKGAMKVFGALDALRYTDAVAKIMKMQTLQPRAAKGRIADYEAWGFIEQGPDGLYRRCNGAE